MIKRESLCATTPDVTVVGVGVRADEGTKGRSVALKFGMTPSSSTSSGVGDNGPPAGGYLLGLLTSSVGCESRADDVFSPAWSLLAILGTDGGGDNVNERTSDIGETRSG